MKLHGNYAGKMLKVYNRKGWNFPNHKFCIGRIGRRATFYSMGCKDARIGPGLPP
jgi:hypothetical protein